LSVEPNEDHVLRRENQLNSLLTSTFRLSG